jgi:C1A family cysteine protease
MLSTAYFNTGEFMTTDRFYGWKPDRPDHRDFKFIHSNVDASTLPEVHDLREWTPKHMDQGTIGSCTAHAIIGAYRTELIKMGKIDKSFSRIQLYFDERFMEGTVGEDSGAQIRDGMSILATKGVAPEELWGYDVSKFTVQPSDEVYAAAKLDLALTYSRVNVSVLDIKAAIAANHPVVIGISVFPSFESPEVARTGIVPMPGPNEQSIGGHALFLAGFNQKPGYFTARNSWGDSWGDKGDCYIPEEYLGNPNLGSDYWIIETVESA